MLEKLRDNCAGLEATGEGVLEKCLGCKQSLWELAAPLVTWRLIFFPLLASSASHSLLSLLDTSTHPASKPSLSFFQCLSSAYCHNIWTSLHFLLSAASHGFLSSQLRSTVSPQAAPSPRSYPAPRQAEASQNKCIPSHLPALTCNKLEASGLPRRHREIQENTWNSDFSISNTSLLVGRERRISLYLTPKWWGVQLSSGWRCCLAFAFPNQFSHA